MHARLLTIAAAAALVAPSTAQDPRYFTVQETEQEIANAARAFPTIAMSVEISALPGASRTWNDNGIFALKVSDNVGISEDEPAILIAAQHHARELNAPYNVINAMQRITSAYGVDPEITALVDSYELWFVPCVNPDGVDHVWNANPNWRKNRRNNGDGTFGVDLNRNYPTAWSRCGSSSSTFSDTYHGPSPGSEPEVQTLRALVAAERPEIYFDFHNFGREVLNTYSPCSATSEAMRGFIRTYMSDLAAPMSYAMRFPSASGEAPEDFWNDSGTLSFLIEVSTSFQPSWSSTVAEEPRVWSGISHAMNTWRPAVRGHVRSIFQGMPIEAQMNVNGPLFREGERTMSRARDGRYGLWLPVGNWSVTWTAPGFQPVTRQIQVGALNRTQTLDIAMVPAWTDPTLNVAGPARLGTTIDLDYASPGDAGLVFVLPLSLGLGAGSPVGTRLLPLDVDPLFVASLNAPALISSNIGVLPAGERITAQLHVPNIPSFAGFSFTAAGITLENGYPLGLKKWSPAVPISFVP